MKSLLRENRIPKGTRAKVSRIIKDLRASGADRHIPENASGSALFAHWKASKGMGR